MFQRVWDKKAPAMREEENIVGEFRHGKTPGSEVIGKFIRTNRRHRRVLEGKLNSTGVFRSQHQLLMYIADYPNLSQKELAKNQGVSTATIAVSLKKLEQGGYVRRVVEPRDNRYNKICITEKVMEVARYSVLVFEEIEKAMFRGFSQEDYRMLGELLDRIYENLEGFGENENRQETGEEEL